MKKDMEPETSLLYWEISDESTRQKNSFKRNVFFLAMIMLLAGFGLWRFFSKVPVSSVNMNETNELEVGSVEEEDMNRCGYGPLDLDVPSTDNLHSMFKELNLFYDKNIGEKTSKILEADVFAHLDTDHDGLLSRDEWRVFIEGSVEELFDGITSEDLKNLKMQYPKFTITDDMSDNEIAKICELAREIDESFDLQMERYIEDPSLLVENAMDVARVPIFDHKTNLNEFDSFLRKDSVATTDEFIIPEQCKKIAIPTRRRGFMIAIVEKVAPLVLASTIAVGAGTGAAIENCVLDGCDSAGEAFNHYSSAVWEGIWSDGWNADLEEIFAKKDFTAAAQERERKRGKSSGLCASVYVNHNRGGDRLDIRPGNIDKLAYKGRWNDHISSMTLFAGCAIELYRNWHYNDLLVRYATDNTEWFNFKHQINDQVSSIKCICQ